MWQTVGPDLASFSVLNTLCVYKKKRRCTFYLMEVDKATRHGRSQRKGSSSR